VVHSNFWPVGPMVWVDFEHFLLFFVIWKFLIGVLSWRPHQTYFLSFIMIEKAIFHHFWGPWIIWTWSWSWTWSWGLVLKKCSKVLGSEHTISGISWVNNIWNREQMYASISITDLGLSTSLTTTRTLTWYISVVSDPFSFFFFYWLNEKSNLYCNI
jgi:hypothetical protein